MNYTHLTREERYQIHALRSQGIGIAAIAAQLVRHRSTIERELARNTSGEGYDPAKAHTQAKARLSGPDNVRTLSPHTWQWAERYLRLGVCAAEVLMPESLRQTKSVTEVIAGSVGGQD